MTFEVEATPLGGVGRNRRVRVRRSTGAALLVIAFILAACGHSSSRHNAAPSTSSGRLPAVTTTTTIEDAALAAYRAEWSDFVAVATHFPVDPTDPRLAQHMTGQELATVRNRLTAAELAGQYLQGTIDLAPVVTSLTGDTATINDCGLDQLRAVDSKSGQPTGPIDTQRTLVRATLQLVDGTWKVATVEPMGAGCVPAP